MSSLAVAKFALAKSVETNFLQLELLASKLFDLIGRICVREQFIRPGDFWLPFLLRSVLYFSTLEKL
jgi:hypothetical protein